MRRPTRNTVIRDYVYWMQVCLYKIRSKYIRPAELLFLDNDWFEARTSIKKKKALFLLKFMRTILFKLIKPLE